MPCRDRGRPLSPAPLSPGRAEVVEWFEFDAKRHCLPEEPVGSVTGKAIVS